MRGYPESVIERLRADPVATYVPESDVTEARRESYWRGARDGILVALMTIAGVML